MTTKEKVLLLFESNRGKYFSGEIIAEELSLSRTAVWKAVKSLQKEGYPISAVRNKGYSLAEDTDIISEQGIRKYLQGSYEDKKITVMSVTESTNALLRERAASGEDEGYILVANEQTKGRGRLGRSFFSPKNTGVYISILLRPKNLTAEQSVKITTMASVAMCKAIEGVSEKEAKIKWVNDIFVEGKKVCGILTEGSFDVENNQIEYVILGLGVNVYEPADGFPKEIENIAGAVLSSSCDDGKNRLCAEFINNFFDLYYDIQNGDYVKEYKARSFVVGKKVSIIKNEKSIPALVIGIDDECHLIAEYENGERESFMSGEISLKV